MSALWILMGLMCILVFLYVVPFYAVLEGTRETYKLHAPSEYSQFVSEEQTSSNGF